MLSGPSTVLVGSGCGRRGQPGRLSRGDVVLGTRYVAGYRAGSWCSVAASTRRAGSRILGMMVQRPPAGTIPDAPGSYQFKDRDGRVIYVGKARSLRQRLSQLLREPEQPAARARRRWWRAAETVEWIQVRNDVEALMLENTLIKQPPAPVQRAAAGRQELPVPRRHPRRRVAPPDGDARSQAQGRALLRALRARLRHPRDPRPAAAHVPAAHLLGQQVRRSTSASAARACCSTSRSARDRAWARSPTEEYDQHVAGPPAVPRRRHRRRGRRTSRPACTRRPASSSSSRRPGSATGSPASRRPSRSSRWWRSAPRTSTCSGSPTTSSRPRCRCSSCARPGGGTQGLHRRQGGGPHPGELVSSVVERLYDDPPQGIPQVRAGAGGARRPRALRGVARHRSGAAG